MKNLGLELAEKVLLYHRSWAGNGCNDTGLWVSIINLASQIEIEAGDGVIREHVAQAEEAPIESYGEQREL